jgi:hypothetical protein
MKEKDSIDITAEVWKDIAGYEGLYQVSNMGRVRSLDRMVKGRYSPYLQKGRVLRYSFARHAKLKYKEVTLCKSGKLKTHLIHRLVAQAFVPNLGGYDVVNHLDENTLNNKSDNLEWCTQKHNINYGTGLQRRSATRKIPVLQYSKNGDFLAEYPSQRDAAQATNGSFQAIGQCCLGHIPSSGGFIWRHKDSILPVLITVQRSTKARPILQYDLSGNLIAEYTSAGDAERRTGANHRQISACCGGRLKKTHGYKWKYKETIKEAS